VRRIGVGESCLLSAVVADGFRWIRKQQPGFASQLAEFDCFADGIGCGADLHRRQTARQCRPGQAAYRQSVLQYEKTVLVAYGDVEDQLAAIHYLARQSQAEASAVADARRPADIALHQYQAGLVSYLDVVVAQQTLLTNEQAATQVNGAETVSTVALIRALGGGWKTSTP
jgi:hypothetical protein